MALSTTRDLIETTRNRVLGVQRGARSQLTTAASTLGTTTLNLARSIDNVQEGSYLEVDLETFYVWAIDPSSGAATVSPGANGTTPAVHAASSMVFVNPEVSASSILDELNVDLGALSSANDGLYAVQTIAITYEPAVFGYDLAGVDRFLHVLEVRYETPDPTNRWPLLHYWHEIRDADPTDFPSGHALVLDGGGWPAAGATIRVACATGFAPLVNMTDDVPSTTGLMASATDIPTLGAAARLLASRESQRNLMGSRSDAERFDAVPAGAAIGASRHLLSLRQSRINEESSALSRAYPMRRF